MSAELSKEDLIAVEDALIRLMRAEGVRYSRYAHDLVAAHKAEVHNLIKAVESDVFRQVVQLPLFQGRSTT